MAPVHVQKVKCKTCTTCGITKNIGDFYPDTRYKSGLRPQCVSCRKRYRLPETRRRAQRRYLATHADERNRTAENRLRNSGWTKVEFESAFAIQCGLCAICGVGMLKNGISRDSVCADHCHSNGKKRALLCRGCNSGLGFFKEDINKLKLAVIYLQQYESSS